jgi:hypothetical protein
MKRSADEEAVRRARRRGRNQSGRSTNDGPTAIDNLSSATQALSLSAPVDPTGLQGNMGPPLAATYRGAPNVMTGEPGARWTPQSTAAARAPAYAGQARQQQQYDGYAHQAQPHLSQPGMLLEPRFGLGGSRLQGQGSDSSDSSPFQLTPFGAYAVASVSTGEARSLVVEDLSMDQGVDLELPFVLNKE